MLCVEWSFVRVFLAPAWSSALWSGPLILCLKSIITLTFRKHCNVIYRHLDTVCDVYDHHVARAGSKN